MIRNSYVYPAAKKRGRHYQSVYILDTKENHLILSMCVVGRFLLCYIAQTHIIDVHFTSIGGCVRDVITLYTTLYRIVPLSVIPT